MSDEDRNRGVPQNALHLEAKGKDRKGGEIRADRKSASEMARGDSSRPTGGLVQSGAETDREEVVRRDVAEGYSEQDEPGFEQSDQTREHRWSQNADDVGRQYDQGGFAQGGRDEPDRQQGWSGETRGDRQQRQRIYDEQIQDDGSMTREQKLQQGWQDPEDPSQVADEGLIDEDEEDAQGGRI